MKNVFLFCVCGFLLIFICTSATHAADSWSTGASGGTARSQFSSQVYKDKIYSWGDYNTVDIYDIESNSWSTGASGGTERFGIYSSVLYKGKIYYWGGVDYGTYEMLNTLDVYDIALNSWSTGASGGTARAFHSAVLYDSKIYYLGGYNNSWESINSVDIYDIESNSWSTGTAGGTARNEGRAEVYNGKIYYWGGVDDNNVRLNIVDIYDIESNTWSAGVTGGTARTAQSSVLYNGKIYYWAGGIIGSQIVNTLDILNIENKVASTLDTPPNAAANQSLTPILKTTATNHNSQYIQYKIDLCTDEAMTLDCQTFDQTLDQTGWSNQNTESGTAYTSGTQAFYTIQADLLYNTTYYWKSYSIEPAGGNTWSNTQTTPYSFTTMSAPTPTPTFTQTSSTSTSSSTSETVQISQSSGDSGGGVIAPIKDSVTGTQQSFVIVEPNTLSHNAFLSSIITSPSSFVATTFTSSLFSSVILPNPVTGILSSSQNKLISNTVFAGNPATGALLGVKKNGTIVWQVGGIHNIWYKTYPPSGSDVAPAKIIPSLQKKPSIIALTYSDANLIPPGKPTSRFNPKNLKLAHSIDGITWVILPTSVVDLQSKTVAALDKVGGYYMIVGK